jgi:hypothetical protein
VAPTTTTTTPAACVTDDDCDNGCLACYDGQCVPQCTRLECCTVAVDRADWFCVEEGGCCVDDDCDLPTDADACTTAVCGPQGNCRFPACADGLTCCVNAPAPVCVDLSDPQACCVSTDCDNGCLACEATVCVPQCTRETCCTVADDRADWFCLEGDECCTAEDCPSGNQTGEAACYACYGAQCTFIGRGELGDCPVCEACGGDGFCVADARQNGDPCGPDQVCCAGICCDDGQVCAELAEENNLVSIAQVQFACCTPLTCADDRIGGLGEPCGAAVPDGCGGTIACRCKEGTCNLTTGLCEAATTTTSACPPERPDLCAGPNANCCNLAGGESCADNGDCCAADRVACGDVCCGVCEVCDLGSCVAGPDDATCSDPDNDFNPGICCAGDCDSSGITTCATTTTTTAAPICTRADLCQSGQGAYPDCVQCVGDDCIAIRQGEACSPFDGGVTGGATATGVCVDVWCCDEDLVCGDICCTGSPECVTCYLGGCLVAVGAPCNGGAGVCSVDGWCEPAPTTTTTAAVPTTTTTTPVPCIPACGACETCVNGACIDDCLECQSCKIDAANPDGICEDACPGCGDCQANTDFPDGVCVPRPEACLDCQVCNVVTGLCADNCPGCETCFKGAGANPDICRPDDTQCTSPAVCCDRTNTCVDLAAENACCVDSDCEPRDPCSLATCNDQNQCVQAGCAEANPAAPRCCPETLTCIPDTPDRCCVPQEAGDCDTPPAGSTACVVGACNDTFCVYSDCLSCESCKTDGALTCEDACPGCGICEATAQAPEGACRPDAAACLDCQLCNVISGACDDDCDGCLTCVKGAGTNPDTCQQTNTNCNQFGDCLSGGICNLDGSCSYTQNDDQCTETGVDDCLDGTCNADGTCSYAPDNLNCDEFGDCLINGVCSAEGACSYTPNDADCTETGVNGCLDGTCNANGTCTYTQNNANCDAFGICLSDGVCNLDGSCSYTQNDILCDDGDDCTINTCNPDGTCGHASAADFSDCTTGTITEGYCLAGVCTACEANGSLCSNNNECCSDICRDVLCRATACVELNQACTSGAQCCSGLCLNNICQCDQATDCPPNNACNQQPTPNVCQPCPNTGEACTANADCCSGSSCFNGFCQCTTNAGCASGEACNSLFDPNICQSCAAGATRVDYSSCSTGSPQQCCSGSCVDFTTSSTPGGISCGGFLVNGTSGNCKGGPGAPCSGGGNACCASGVCLANNTCQ